MQRLFCCNSSLPQFSWFACWLHCTDCWVLKTLELKINHSKMFWFKFWNSRRAVQESECTQNFGGWLCSPRRPVLNQERKAESTQSFYILALNTSRKVHTLKCKWYFLGLSDNSNLESFRLTGHRLRGFAPTHSLMTDQITNLYMKNITQASTQPFHHPHLPS